MQYDNQTIIYNAYIIDSEDEIDIEQVTRAEFEETLIDSDCEVTYERSTMFENGSNAIIITACNIEDPIERK